MARTQNVGSKVTRRAGKKTRGRGARGWASDAGRPWMTPRTPPITQHQVRLAEEGGDPLFPVKQAFMPAHRRAALLSR